MTALLAVAILFTCVGTLMYGAHPPKKHPGAVAIVRPTGVLLVIYGAMMAFVLMAGAGSGISV